MKRLLLTSMAVIVSAWSWAQCSGNMSHTNNDPTFAFTFTPTSGNFDWFIWDFGDGNYAYNPNATHTYATNGVYTYCLTAGDSATGCTVTYCDSFAVNNANAGGSCAAMFSDFTDSLGTTYFTDQSTNATSWYWDFGDGTTSTMQYPTHTYGTSGAYLVCLTISDGASCTDTYCDSVLVGNQGGGSCIAAFNSYDSLNTVYFWNSSTGSNLSYYWDFGDGTSSTQQHPAHTYNSTGTYTACLTVYNGNCTNTTCQVVTVQGQGSNCSADFVTYTDTANGPANVIYLINLATGNNLSYSWTFGDGNTSTQQYPTHTYAQNGSYMVCLTIDDGAGCTDTYCDTVTYFPMQGSGFTINVVPPSASSIDEPQNISIEPVVYPNPTNSAFTLQLTSGQSTGTTITIMDVAGRVIHAQRAGLYRGETLVQLDAGSWTKGIYMIRVQTEEGSIATTRLMVR